MSWVVVFPFDVIKSIVQTRPLSQGGKDLGMMATARELLRTRGPKVFFRGMSVALMRALPVNCIVFPVYEGTVKVLGQLRRSETTGQQIGGVAIDGSKYTAVTSPASASAPAASV